jgi:hypothetical protein
MIGKFTIKQNGVVIDEAYNTITNTGKKQLVEFIGKLRDGWAEEMSFGVGTGASNATNEWMGLEVYSCPVSIARVDPAGQNIVLKANIEQDAQFRFTELGIRPSKTFKAAQDSSMEKILSFDTTEGIVTSPPTVRHVDKDDAGSFAGSTYGLYVRDGSNSLYVGSGGDITIERELDLLKYASTAKILVGVVPTSALNQGFGTGLYFYVAGSGNAKYFLAPTGAGSANTYNILAIPISSLTAQGGAVNADLANISSIRIQNLSGGNQLWDTLRVERQDNSIVSDVLFSRATTSLKTKWAGLPLDIEYTINLGL